MKVDEIIKNIKIILPEIKSEYDFEEIGVFGSYVKNNQTENSDLDILIMPGKKMDLYDFIGLKLDLSDKLGMKVDLANKRTLKKRIGKRILEEVVYIE